MIEIRRSDQAIIRADPISEKDREKAWLEYIRAAGPEAIKEVLKQNERAV